jgi:hypothetical protein
MGKFEDLECAKWILALLEKIKPSLAKANLVTWANDVPDARAGRAHPS